MSIEDKYLLMKTLPSQPNNILSNKLFFIPSPSIDWQTKTKSVSNVGGLNKKNENNNTFADFEMVLKPNFKKNLIKIVKKGHQQSKGTFKGKG